MTRYIALLIVLTAAAFVQAADNCCPVPVGDKALAQAPAAQLPAGHPPLPGALPEGHPTLPSGHPPLPEGHPALPGTNPRTNPGALPDGHPPLPSGHPPLPGVQAEVPATQPAINASIVIHAVQGTAGEKAPAGAKVFVQLMQGRNLVKRLDATLDDQGFAKVENIPLASPVTPQAIVIYQGVGYQAKGKPMGPGLADQQQIEVKVYETTTTPPAWTIPVRHLMIAPDEDGLTVSDIITIENPTDRTWIAKETGGEDQVTITLPLPKGAVDVSPVTGFFREQTHVHDGALLTSTPMTAGRTQLSLTYRIPPTTLPGAEGGKATVPILVPAPTESIMVFLPDDDSTITVTGLTDDGKKQMGNTSVHGYSATKLKTGHVAELTIANAKFAQQSEDDEVAPHAATKLTASRMPQVIAGVGVVGALLVGAVLMFLRKPARKEA